MNWIKVEDGLPTKETKGKILMESGELRAVWVVVYNAGHPHITLFDFQFNEFVGDNGRDCTHWAEITPPEE